MKGALRRIQDHIKNRTNFNDWSDPKCDYLRKKDPELISPTKKEGISSVVLTKESVISETSKEIDDIQRNVKAGNPLLTLDEIRDLKLPYNESLLSKLHDKGFIGTYQFIKDVIELDDKWHKMAEHDNLVRKRPQLKHNEHALSMLSEGLCYAEIASKDGNKADELGCILDLALGFTKLDDGSWYWLSEELYEQCIHITDSVESPTDYHNELAAVLKYLYAQFLLDFLDDTKRAKHLVEESMKLSVGTFYNTTVLTGQMKDFLYNDSCILLHRILLAMAHESRESNIESSIQLCKQSLYWAKVIKSKVAEMKALLDLVEIYVTSKQVDKIADPLETYLKLCIEHNDIPALCEGYKLSAKYHNLTEERDLEGEDLNALLKTAKQYGLLEIIALAHHRLALFFISHENKLKDAEAHAREAYYCYLNLKKKPEIETLSCLVGVCQSQAILAEYINLLSRADIVCSENFSRLIKWKTLRIPFFNNVKCLQIESEQNVFLQDKMDDLRNDEINYKEPDDVDLMIVSIRSHQSVISRHSGYSQLMHR